MENSIRLAYPCHKHCDFIPQEGWRYGRSPHGDPGNGIKMEPHSKKRSPCSSSRVVKGSVRVAKCECPRVLNDQKLSEDKTKLRVGCPADYENISAKNLILKVLFNISASASILSSQNTCMETNNTLHDKMKAT